MRHAVILDSKVYKRETFGFCMWWDNPLHEQFVEIDGKRTPCKVLRPVMRHNGRVFVIAESGQVEIPAAAKITVFDFRDTIT